MAATTIPITTTTITGTTTPAIADPKLAAIADRALKTFQLAAEKALANLADSNRFPLPADSGSAEQLFLTHFKRKKPAVLQPASQRAAARLSAPDLAAKYGDLAGIQLHSTTPVAQQAVALPLAENLKFSISHLASITGPSGELVAPIASKPASLKEAASKGAFRHLALRIEKVKCVDAVSWQWIGDSDEIALGGLTIDATGETDPVPEFRVGGSDFEFDNGTEKDYNPPGIFNQFDLTKDGAGQDAYAAFWRKEAGGPIEIRTRLTRQGYQQAFNDLGGKGFRLREVSAYALNGQELYTAIWEKPQSPTPPWIAHHAMTRDQYQNTFTDLANKGYRLVHVNACGVGGVDLYAAIWEKSAGPAWESHHAMTADQYQKTFSDLATKGFRLVKVCGYSLDVVGGQSQDLYAGIWEKRPSPPWAAYHGMTPQDYQQHFNDLGAQGYRLTDVSGYSVGDQLRFAAIWEKSPGPAWLAKHNMTQSEYQKAFVDLGQQGYHLAHVSGYSIWPKFPRSYFATLVLAEKQDGGFADFLQKLWNLVKDKVTAWVAAAIGAAIGTDIIPGLGTIIGAIVGWVLGWLFGFIDGLFKDRISEPFTVAITVPSLNARFAGGGNVSSPGLVRYEWSGGTYELTFDWALVP